MEQTSSQTAQPLLDSPAAGFKSILVENHSLLSRCLVVSPGLLCKLKSVDYMDDKVPQIRRLSTADQKVTELLNILDEVPVDEQQLVFSTLLSILRQDGQEHVANIFCAESDTCPMSDEHYQILVSRQRQVCQCLDPQSGIVDELIIQKTFNDADSRSVTNKSSHDDMSREVINILLRKPDSAFNTFINALCTTNQEHVASLLGYPTTSTPMTDEHRRLLSSEKTEIAKFMDPRYELIDRLVKDGIFNNYDENQVRNKTDIEAICLHVIDTLLRKSDAAFDLFIGALCSSKQEHVASLLGHESSEKPMTKEHSQLLFCKTEELSQFINPNYMLLSKLAAVDVFNKREMDSVMSKPSYTEKSIELVNILLRKSDSSFDKFIEALKNTEQQHVVHILTGQGELSVSRVRRLVLRKARDKLVSRVDTLHTPLLAKLISSEVLAHDDKQRIEAHKVNDDRTAELIDIIARKSQVAYDRFIQALKDSGHSKVAEELEGLELRGIIDPHFLTGVQPAERSRIVQVVRNNMQALVSGKGDGIGELTSLMEQNGFAVSEVSIGSIRIRFRCFTEESLVNLKRLYTDKTLDKLFTKVFCPPFADQGLESLELHIADNETDKKTREPVKPANFALLSPKLKSTGRAMASLFTRMLSSPPTRRSSQQLTTFYSLPVELLELVLIKTFIKLFTKWYGKKSKFKTHEAIRLSYITLVRVCKDWWQTVNGWPQSPTKHWFKHKLLLQLNYVCRPYVVSPRLQFSQSMPDGVWGVAQCDNKLFVVCYQSSTIRVFGSNNEQQTDIELEQLSRPLDIVSCTETQQLYVADESRDSIYCVWRVSLDGRQVVKWLSNKPATTQFSSWTKFRPHTLSVTSRRLLVTSHVNNELLLYGADGVELKRVPFPDKSSLQHAVETSRGTFIVCHSGRQPRVCEVNVNGHAIHVFCDQQQLSLPVYLSSDADGRIFIADYSKHHILLLNSERLELERVLLDTQQHKLTDLRRVCYREQADQLAVAGYSGCLQLFTVR